MVTTRRKSASVRVMPMPSRISCTSGVMACFSSNPPQEISSGGCATAALPTASTQNVKPSPCSTFTNRVQTASAANSSASVRLMAETVMQNSSC